MTPTRVEPTEAMIEAGVKFAMSASVHGKYSWRAYIADLWRHMLAASPPESVQASGAVESLVKALEPFAGYGEQLRRRRSERSPQRGIIGYPVQTEDDPLGLKYAEITQEHFLQAEQAVRLWKHSIEAAAYRAPAPESHTMTSGRE